MCVMSCVTWHDHVYVHLYCKSANVPGSDKGYSGGQVETDETENGNRKLKRKTETESGNGKAENWKWSSQLF